MTKTEDPVKYWNARMKAALTLALAVKAERDRAANDAYLVTTAGRVVALMGHLAKVEEVSDLFGNHHHIYDMSPEEARVLLRDVDGCVDGADAVCVLGSPSETGGLIAVATSQAEGGVRAVIASWLMSVSYHEGEYDSGLRTMSVLEPEVVLEGDLDDVIERVGMIVTDVVARYRVGLLPAS